MVNKQQILRFARIGNRVITALLRAGIKLNGLGYPMYLLTVLGRKSGLPRTTPIVVLMSQNEYYLGSPYGMVDWVRNLRAAGEATLTRGRRTETFTARELSPKEAAPVLKEAFKKDNPFVRTYGVTPQSSLEEFERAALTHPFFHLQRVS
ncbi:nitroreductase [Ktedonobacter sp. SOSP1-52]|uniref:nitroreductase family deazaflavin-dependent oxidoreductase n=1 Tax=Ktedonobacter sp. SOSP1-52 TaxID=2778366 RepID=UPI0019155181|nr:nitroreductase family deazaflavin-dependent oxidoreductase [Ktedonobacter sp. SOSP1-52]GHO63052.1 nitroreductase [Ktedonobacter sp. SOSP1-52]